MFHLTHFKHSCNFFGKAALSHRLSTWVCVASALASLLSPWKLLPSACNHSWQANIAHTFPSIGDDFLVIVGISQVCVSSRLDTAGLILEIIKEAWLSLTVWELCNACECLEGGSVFLTGECWNSVFYCNSECKTQGRWENVCAFCVSKRV